MARLACTLKTNTFAYCLATFRQSSLSSVFPKTMPMKGVAPLLRAVVHIKPHRKAPLALFRQATAYKRKPGGNPADEVPFAPKLLGVRGFLKKKRLKEGWWGHCRPPTAHSGGQATQEMGGAVAVRVVMQLHSTCSRRGSRVHLSIKTFRSRISTNSAKVPNSTQMQIFHNESQTQMYSLDPN